MELARLDCDWDELYLFLKDNVSPRQPLPKNMMEWDVAPRLAWMKHEEEEEDGYGAVVPLLKIPSGCSSSSSCYDYKQQGFPYQMQQQQHHQMYGQYHLKPPGSTRVRRKRSFFDCYESSENGDDQSSEATDAAFSPRATYHSSYSFPQLDLGKVDEFADPVPMKRPKRDTFVSWSDGTLHLDFLKCILQIGLQNGEAYDIMRGLEMKGIIAPTEYCESFLNDKQRCEDLLTKEYEMAKETAADLVKPKSKLCKPKLHVYPFNPFTNDPDRKLERAILSYIFDVGLELAKPQEIFELMNNRGHRLSCNRKIKSHLQKFTLNSRSSHAAFWNNLCLQM